MRAWILGATMLMAGCGAETPTTVRFHEDRDLPALRVMANANRTSAGGSIHYRCRGCHETKAEVEDGRR